MDVLRLVRACAGNWRVVTVLLVAGANPRRSAGISAAECTRQRARAKSAGAVQFSIVATKR
jgi:hypothetical protein